MAICSSIKLVENDVVGGDLLRVTIDNTETAYWFYNYADAMQYVGQEVIVQYRKDIYKGELVQFIKTFVVPTAVTTLEKKDNIKLYIDQVDNNSNISFSDIAIGETAQGCIVYCTHSEFKSSKNAVWQEFIIRDKAMHTAKLRVFDYANDSADMSGQYIMTALSRNKYGFQSDFVAPANGTVANNPEIDIAINFIENYFSTDVAAMTYINKTQLIEHLKEVIDYEKGYALMRLAMELSMVESLENVTKDVDLNAIGRAILCSYGHYTRTSVLSDSVANVTLALQFPFENKTTVVPLLDVALEEKPKEYEVMHSIQSAVAAILEVRKGTQ